MIQAVAWTPFVQNDNNLLWLALTGRDAGERCSVLIGVESPTLALNLDLACSHRLVRFENKREFDRLKAFKQMMKQAIAEAIFGAKPPEENDPDPEEIDEDDVL